MAPSVAWLFVIGVVLSGACGNAVAPSVAESDGGGCVPGAPCDDGDPCTADDKCVDGDFCEGTPYECSDGKECTVDSCDGAGGCVFEIQAGACLINGVCRLEGEPHPELPCKECTPAVSKTEWSADDTNECDDGDLCLEGEHCSDGECVPGKEKKDCDDGNPCTTDSCVPETGCEWEPTSEPCDDGDKCTEEDTCSDGACLGKPVECDDGNPCTENSCDKDEGCVAVPNEKPCDDGDACTVGDICKNGKCSAGSTAPDCDDQNVCTDDFCDPLTGCQHEPNASPCDDGDACMTGDTCLEGECMPGPDEVDCDDGNNCTADSCQPDKGCLHEPELLACDDGNACTVGDTCEKGACASGPALLDCDDENPCTNDLCESASGCAYAFNSAVCSDGSECTVGDVCAEGVCTGQTKVCDDGNPCTTDTCNPKVIGGCVQAPNDLPCDDNDPCTLGDTCVGGVCMPGAGKLMCDDFNQCTQDACVKGVGCQSTNAPLPCDDGNACTVGDYCGAGNCIGGVNACSCQSDADCAMKEDGDQCNGTLFCDKAQMPYSCRVDPATVIVCNKALDTACSVQQCLPQTGKCLPVAVNDSMPCDDGNQCTSFDKCSSGTCSGTPIPACGVGAACLSDKDCSVGLSCVASMPGGYCVKANCDVLGCPAGSTCWAMSNGGHWCLKNCSGPCDGIGWEGCCAGELLSWCQDGALELLDCSANPTCGWSAADGYYDCGTVGTSDPGGLHPKDCAGLSQCRLTDSYECDNDGACWCGDSVCTPGKPICNGSVATSCNACGSGPTPGGVDCSALGQVCYVGKCTQQVIVADRWVLVGNGVVQDLKTGLFWTQQGPAAPSLLFGPAQQYCTGLALGGIDSWRLPTIDELRSLVVGCPLTATGGACGVGVGCLTCVPNSTNDCGSNCGGCAAGGGPASSGCYFEAGVWSGGCAKAWSSSTCNSSTESWIIYFNNAQIIDQWAKAAEKTAQAWCVAGP